MISSEKLPGCLKSICVFTVYSAKFYNNTNEMTPSISIQSQERGCEDQDLNIKSLHLGTDLSSSIYGEHLRHFFNQLRVVTAKQNDYSRFAVHPAKTKMYAYFICYFNGILVDLGVGIRGSRSGKCSFSAIK